MNKKKSCNKVCSHCVGGACGIILGFQLYIPIELCACLCTHLQYHEFAIPTKLQNVALDLDMHKNSCSKVRSHCVGGADPSGVSAVHSHRVLYKSVNTSAALLVCNSY
jgi:hypothetical protein